MEQTSQRKWILMRRYLALMLLFSGVCTDSADAQVKVFILAGQSNAVGFAGNANDLPAALREPFDDVLFWYDIGGRGVRPSDDTHVRPREGTSTWVPLRPQEEFDGRVVFDKPNAGFTGLNITTGHGAELTLGRELAENLSDEIAILKFAWNGTNLASTSGMDWNVSSNAEYYDALVEETATALSHLETDLGKSGAVAGFFWVQGDADAYAATAGLYGENLTALVDSARDEWGETLPVVIAQTHKDFINWAHPVIPKVVEPYLSQIRAAQQSVAATSQFSRLVDVDDIPLASDSNHFDSAGLQIVGQRFAETYLAIAAAPPPGDFNQDGTVDAADYIVWRKGLGTEYTQGDHDLWRAHFGATAGSGTTLSSVEPLPAVPEPLTSALIGLAFMSLFPLRLRRLPEGSPPGAGRTTE
jgi:hypothetical protein